ncbi:MAG: aspartate aminotransferase family protein [Abditibacteriales bacterium]|nr:aspartate aminotransferase family protein [Abditibacteriales bacterium]MDW8366343.1 aspartate aminotransferase family protein [Abditibacteriales bacterium]
MTDLRSKFAHYLCQTSTNPLGLVVERAQGSTIYTTDGREYLDFVSGIAVTNVGFTHPAVVEAVKAQAEKYLHVMVYGEYVQAPQVELAERLASVLPDPLHVVYFTNSGTEANEGALKVAKKFTKRRKLIAFDKSFHGDTHGAASLLGNPAYRCPYEPLLPDVEFLPFDETTALERIDETVAAVMIEPIQGEAGVRVPSDEFLPALRQRCDEVGALLIFDEVQTGCGRTGKLFALEHWNIVPDIITLAKGLGGGMPLGAFVGSAEVMRTLSEDPPLSHVTTFGGHPVCCAAGLASLNIILEQNLPQRAATLGEQIRERLEMTGKSANWGIDVRGKGLMLAVEFPTAAQAIAAMERALQEGLILTTFLHADNALRLAPALTISEAELHKGLDVLERAMQVVNRPVV